MPTKIFQRQSELKGTYHIRQGPTKIFHSLLEITNFEWDVKIEFPAISVFKETKHEDPIFLKHFHKEPSPLFALSGYVTEVANVA